MTPTHLIRADHDQGYEYWCESGLQGRDEQSYAIENVTCRDCLESLRLHGLRAQDRILYLLFTLPHLGHGQGTEEGGPDEPDCSCRGTGAQWDCADAGCGFCRAQRNKDLNEETTF